jgi:uncharacterized coiled-coil protein SlyX
MLGGSVGGQTGSVQSSVGKPSQRNQFDQQMDRIWQALGVGSDKALAAALGKAQTTISAARTKKAIPEAWLSILNQKYDLNIKWILTGKGPKRVGELFSPPDNIVSATVEQVQSPQPVEGASHPPPGLNPPDLQGIRISEALQATARVLESGTSYAVALFLNIQHFDRAIKAESRITDLEQLANQHKARISEMNQIIEDQSCMMASMQEASAISACKIGDLEHIVRGQNDDIAAMRRVISDLQEQFGQWGRKPRDSIQRDGTEEDDYAGSAGGA